MSAPPDASPRLDADAFVQLWAEALSQVLRQITSSPVPCSALPEAPPEVAGPADSDQWIVCTCAGALRGEMALRLSAAVLLRLAQTFIGEPPVPEAELTTDHREAGMELLRQVGGIVATALKSRWGETQLRFEVSAGSPSWTASSTWWLRLGGEQVIAVLESHLSAALGASMRIENKAETPPPAEAAAPLPPPSPVVNDSRLALLMDVELGMTLRFGGRRMLLGEVLDLCPGTVIELDRQIEEPAELMLDGKLIARGEVVVIDGNYGLRVKEVAGAGDA